MKELLQCQIIFGLLVQIKLRKAASCLKVNYTMYFQPPLWVHFRVLIGQKCWLNIALKVTSHRKYPSAILHGLVIVEHIPSLIGPDHLTIGQTSSVPTWVLIAQNSECCLNIVLHNTFSHYLNIAQYSNISILHCTQSSEQHFLQEIVKILTFLTHNSTSSSAISELFGCNVSALFHTEYLDCNGAVRFIAH